MFQKMFKRTLVGIAVFGSPTIATAGGGEVRSRRCGWCSLRLVVCCVECPSSSFRSSQLPTASSSSYCIRLGRRSDLPNSLLRFVMLTFFMMRNRYHGVRLCSVISTGVVLFVCDSTADSSSTLHVFLSTSGDLRCLASRSPWYGTVDGDTFDGTGWCKG
jgi:hypothetical protein